MRCRVCGDIIKKEKSICPDCEADVSFIEYASCKDGGSLCIEKQNSPKRSTNKYDFLEKKQRKKKDKYFSSNIDGMTVVLSLIVLVILFGTAVLLIRQSVTPLFSLESDFTIQTETTAVIPSSPSDSHQQETLAFVRERVQILPGEYIELREYLNLPATEDWLWSSSNADLVSVNSAGVATSMESGAIADISVYSGSHPENRATIQVVCLSEEAQHEIMEIEHLNNELYPFGVIDLETVRFEPTPRNSDGIWDPSRYYLIEEVVAGDDRESRISAYMSQQNRRICAHNEYVIDYDIFRHPQSGLIHRITSTAYLWDGTMTITDYLFDDDGKLNYACVRLKAGPVFDGAHIEYAEHLYFDQDVLVRYRGPDGTGERMHITVGEAEQSAHNIGTSSTLYDELSVESQDLFDRREAEIINEAYMTYYSLIQDRPVHRIVGIVTDQEGQPISEAVVTLLSDQYDGVELYHVKTNSRGEYSIYTSLESSDYALRFEKEDYITVDTHTASFSKHTVDQFQEQVIMPYTSTESTEIVLLVADAVVVSDEIVWQDRFDTELLRISSAQINIRSGLSHTQGEVIATISTDGHGIAGVELPAGAYTAEVIAEGYMSIYSNFYVFSGRQTERIFMLPDLESNQMGIMLMWQDAPEDLDLHMFTPHSRAQNALDYHVGFDNVRDLAGNQYHVDSKNGFGPEAITINAFEKGTYRIFVTDYDNCLSDNNSTQTMYRSQARVYTYTGDGEVSIFHVPVNFKGNIWSVFEIRNQTIIPTQRFYAPSYAQSWCAAPKADD